MATHTVGVSSGDDDGQPFDTVDILWQCSAGCMYETLDKIVSEDDKLLRNDREDSPFRAGTIVIDNSDKVPPSPGRVAPTTVIEYGGWPGGSETDYAVYCSGCGTLLWHGLQCWGEGAELICDDPDYVDPEDVF